MQAAKRQNWGRCLWHLRRYCALLASLLLCAQMIGCVNSQPRTTPVPIINKSPTRVIPPQIKVPHGESLYSIAWRFGLDWENLAELNGIRKPYTVRAGQTLRLTSAAPVAEQVASSASTKKQPARANHVRVAHGDTLYSIARRYELDWRAIAKLNRMRAPYTVKSGQVLRLPAPKSTATDKVKKVPKSVVKVTREVVKSTTTAPTTATPSSTKKSTPKSTAKSSQGKVVSQSLPSTPPKKWNWPVRGELLERFSPSAGQNGIKITGASGSPVRATAAGQVVYAGEGLRGYGKLIIVKHSTAYLSAYAHNQRILVSEGERIRSKQQIAQMGNSEADRVMLHFEIRKNGAPVDPLKFLN